MIKALWFFLQLLIVLLASLWLLEQPGSVSIEFKGQSVQAPFGISVIFFGGFVLLALLLFRVFNGIANIPSFLGRKRAETRRQKGFQALTKGFVAIAAGNMKEAAKFSKLTRTLLPDEQGLLLLLEAQAARLKGDEQEARQKFEALRQDKDASFLGVRGLLKAAMQDGNASKSLEFAREALSKNPKQPWILKCVYDLEIQNQRWDEVISIQKKALKYEAISKEKAQSDKISILLLNAQNKQASGYVFEAEQDIKKAYNLDKTFMPSVLEMAGIYKAQSAKFKLRSVVEKAWRHDPHPALYSYWDFLAPENTKRSPMKRLHFFEKVLAMKPDSVYSQIIAARAAIDCSLWGEAKAYLFAAEKIENLADIYHLRAEIERKTTNNEDVIQNWLIRAGEARTGKVWYCTLTGLIYERWSAVAQPHGSFNTIIWGDPGARTAYATETLSPSSDALLIEPAA